MHAHFQKERASDASFPNRGISSHSPIAAQPVQGLVDTAPISDSSRCAVSQNLRFDLSTIPPFPSSSPPVRIQRKADHAEMRHHQNQENNVGRSIRQRLLTAKGRGEPLPQRAQQTLEQGFNTDLSHVRLHTDTQADALAHAVNARAFTSGSDIFFRKGMYHSNSSQGFSMLAHEVTHVIQQARGPVTGTLCAGGLLLSSPTDRFERQADTVTQQIAAGRSADNILASRSKGENRARPMTLSAENTRAALPIQRLIGFEFETKIQLHPGPGERTPQKDQKLLEGKGWQLTAETNAAYPEKVVEFKTTALDDQEDSSRLDEAMEMIESALTGVAMSKNKSARLGLLSPYGKVVEGHKNTTLKFTDRVITARPQVTGGIHVNRILHLIEEMGSGTPASQKELMAVKGEEGDKIRGNLAQTAKRVKGKLSGEPDMYQGFISLLVTYIAQAHTFPVNRYYKGIIPALSRMNLGDFLTQPLIQERKAQVIDHIQAILPKLDLSGLMFPDGVFNSETKRIEKDPTTIKDWINYILEGADRTPWSLNVNQREEPFSFEEAGPAHSERQQRLGVPIEIRSLRSRVPFYEWKPLAMHLFRYIQNLNDWQENPPVFKHMLETMTEKERTSLQARTKFYQDLLSKLG